MELKKENPRTPMRMKLSKALREKKLSMNIVKKVVSLLKNMTDEQAEEKASQILTILTSCKTESDVLTKLELH